MFLVRMAVFLGEFEAVLWAFSFLAAQFGVRDAHARNSIRIVDEPASFGIGNDLIQAGIRDVHPVPHARPANFSGPQQLKLLQGLCFDLDSGKYRYSLCPFDNVTQYSVNQWPSYHAVLGVWRGWEISNNTFRAMLMADGDLCGEERRRVEVTMSCNTSEAVAHVAEPEKCRYRMHFWTRLVCHPEAMLVYPRLPAQLRDRWDELYTQFVAEDITEKGYEDGLRAIFVEAGLQPPPPIPQLTELSPAAKSTTVARVDATLFESLPQCQSEYEKLRKELDSLRLLLALNELPGEDTKT